MVLVLRTRSYLRVPSTHRHAQTHTDTHRESIIKICALSCIAFSLEHTRIRYCVSHLPLLPAPPTVNCQIASENLFRQLPFTDNSRVQWFPWNHLKFTLSSLISLSSLSSLSSPIAQCRSATTKPKEPPLHTHPESEGTLSHVHTHRHTHTHNAESWETLDLRPHSKTTRKQ